jgi:hypothetical protein
MPVRDHRSRDEVSRYMLFELAENQEYVLCRTAVGKRAVLASAVKITQKLAHPFG